MTGIKMSCSKRFSVNAFLMLCSLYADTYDYVDVRVYFLVRRRSAVGIFQFYGVGRAILRNRRARSVS